MPGAGGFFLEARRLRFLPVFLLCSGFGVVGTTCSGGVLILAGIEVNIFVFYLYGLGKCGVYDFFLNT